MKHFPRDRWFDISRKSSYLQSVILYNVGIYSGRVTFIVLVVYPRHATVRNAHYLGEGYKASAVGFQQLLLLLESLAPVPMHRTIRTLIYA